jgi:uncharacterized protein
MGVAVQSSLRITLSRDKLRAHLVVRDAVPKEITPSSIQVKLEECGIAINDAVTARIDELVKAAQSGKLPAEPFLLAEGKAPVDPVPASFRLIDDEQQGDSADDCEGRIDFRESNILTVKAGQPLGMLTPEVPAVPGIDVCGAPVPGNKASSVFQLGSNVKLSGDGKAVVATASGKVLLTRQSISVVEVVEIKGDVDYSSGNVESPTDVLITGTIRDTFTVRSEKSVSVKETVEGAIVEAGTHIQIMGGIAGRGAARIRAGGEVHAKYCEEADIEAAGDVVITRQIINSRVRTTRQLVVARGSVIGGHLYARGGASIKTLGNEANIRTEIAIGIAPEVLADADRADQAAKKKRETAEKVRKTVQPLLAQIKRLTSEQREKATELMYEADQMMAEATECEKKKQESLAKCSPDPDSNPTLIITSMIYPGVVIIFGNKMALMSKPRRGPIKIVRRLIDRVEEIVVVDQISGSVQPLPSCQYVPEPGPHAAQNAPDAN